MKRTLQALVMVCLLAAAVAPADANGPDDGIWTFILSNPTAGTAAFFASFHQSGPTVVIFLLSPDTGTWLLGFGTRVSDIISGSVVYPDGSPFGRFLLRIFTNGGFVGVAEISDTTYELSGGKLF